MDVPLAKRIAATLPDVPRWISARSMLSKGHAVVFGNPDMGGCIVVRRDFTLAQVVGPPGELALLEVSVSLTDDAHLLCPPESEGHVGRILNDWNREQVILHGHKMDGALPSVTHHDIRFLSSNEIESIDESHASLKHELIQGLERSPVAGAFVGAMTVAFCYSADETETLWDISVDTLPDYRNRGFAGRCAAFMISHMKTRGRSPVWGSVVSNIPSMRLAEKLGFVPVDRLIVFSRTGRTA